MAGLYNPPNKNEAFGFVLGLQDLANPGSYLINPTLAAGDFQIDIDGAGFNNLGTLPAVRPAGTAAVYFIMTNTEMDGDIITWRCVDQSSPKLWGDILFSIPTS